MFSKPPHSERSDHGSSGLPCRVWLRQYHTATAAQDALAAAIVTLLLIPQSLAYALLAGVPLTLGLYASLLPLVVYAIFGSSYYLSVGPAAVLSLMNMAVLQPLYPPGSPEFIAASALIALLSGLILLGMARLRLGFLANFLSHPVISGFMTASALLIAFSQLKYLFGVGGGGDTLPRLLISLWQHLPETSGLTLLLGLSALGLLYAIRSRLKAWLCRRGLSVFWAETWARTGPVWVLVLLTALVALLGLDQQGVRIVGAIPAGLPELNLPPLDWDLAVHVFPAAVLLSLVGFVESVSVGHTLAARRRQRINPDQELVGLGAANLASAFSGGLAVTGGVSRSVANFEAGAQTPMAGIMTAVGVALSLAYLTPLLYYLPHAVLAATIIIAVLGLMDFHSLRQTWHYSKHDGLAQWATLIGVLALGVEQGLLLGVGLSLVLFLGRTSRPHIAVVGQLPGSEHFRNIERFAVQESPLVLSLRLDESLYFPNARYLEDRVSALLVERPQVRHLVLMCSGVNLIDASGLDSLEAIRFRLQEAGIALHLSEVKGPVMDRLQRSEFLQRLSGPVFLSQYQALCQLDPEFTAQTLAARDAARPIPLAAAE